MLIQKCFWKSTVIKKLEQEVIQEENQQADHNILQAQIAKLPGIENFLPFNKFIKLANKVIDNKDTDIFTSVVD